MASAASTCRMRSNANTRAPPGTGNGSTFFQPANGASIRARASSGATTSTIQPCARPCTRPPGRQGSPKGQLPHLSSQLCDPSPDVRLRHPHHPGAARPQGCEDDHDLYPHPRQHRRPRRHEPRRHPPSAGGFVLSTLIPIVLACLPRMIRRPQAASRGVSVILRVGDLRREKPVIPRAVGEIPAHVSSQIFSIAN